MVVTNEYRRLPDWLIKATRSTLVVYELNVSRLRVILQDTSVITSQSQIPISIRVCLLEVVSRAFVWKERHLLIQILLIQ